MVLPVICGAALVLVYVSVAVYFSRRHQELAAAAPWFGIGAFALMSGILTAATRIHWGVEQAVDSRYATISINLLISLIGLAVVFLLATDSGKITWRIAMGPSLSAAGVAALVVLYGVGLPSDLDQFHKLHRATLKGKAALQFSRVLPDVHPILHETLMITQDAPTLHHDIEILDRLGLLNPLPRKTLELTDAEDRPNRSTDEYGRFELVEPNESDSFRARGWSYLPIDNLPGPTAVLAYRKGASWFAFRFSQVRQIRRDVVLRHKSRKYLGCGWSVEFPRRSVPPDAREISAWALNANRDLAYKLPGSFFLSNQQ
jgi:hypothetical protein